MHPISEAIVKCFKNGGKLFVCGNGGSASMSSHFVGEFVGKFEKDRKALPAISLTSDIATITAVANDFGYEFVFSRQLEALGKPGDILITLSTSGTSKNIIKAQEKARELGIEVIEFPDKFNVRLFDIHAAFYGAPPSTAETQEYHLKLIHRISREVEEAMFP